MSVSSTHQRATPQPGLSVPAVVGHQNVRCTAGRDHYVTRRGADCAVGWFPNLTRVRMPRSPFNHHRFTRPDGCPLTVQQKLLRFSAGLLAIVSAASCAPPPGMSSPADRPARTVTSSDSKRPTTGGDGGQPVPPTRLRGAALSWIGARRDLMDAFQWNFDERTFELVSKGPALPIDLVQLLTGRKTPRRRIVGEWHTSDGRQLEMTVQPPSADQTERRVILTIETAGVLRANLGDGRQYNILRRQPVPR